MAKANGVLGRETITSKRIIDDRHPAVIRFKEFKEDNGIIKSGELVALDTNNDVVLYDPSGAAPEDTPVGVCVEDIDTAKETIGSVMVHGTVVKSSLTTKGLKSDDADINKLEEKTAIWAF